MSTPLRTISTAAASGTSVRAYPAVTITRAWNAWVATTIAFGTHKHPRRRPRT